MPFHAEKLLLRRRVWSGEGEVRLLWGGDSTGERSQMRMSAWCGSEPSLHPGLDKKIAGRVTKFISKELSPDVSNYSSTQGPGYSKAQGSVWGLRFHVWPLEPTTMPVSQSFLAALSWGLYPHCLPGTGTQMTLVHKACLRSQEQLPRSVLGKLSSYS